jgi:UDP-GlcNAc:undecaprenyl-phosphate GlcNAc-1-phosphate transferase
MGLTHRRAVLILYALSILFTVGSIIVSIGRNSAVGAALVIITIAVIGVIRAMGNFDVALRRWRRKERIRSIVVDRLRHAVPAALGKVLAAREARDVASILREFAQQAELQVVSLTGPDNGSAIEPFQWKVTDRSNAAEHGFVTAAYPLVTLGSSAMLSFSWQSETSDLAPEAEILLQLIADACNHRIGRSSEARLAGVASHLRSV